MPITEQQVREALATIVDNKQEKSLNYAVNYALDGIGMSGHVLKAQIPYVLGNMTYWRGTKATGVRAILKQFARENR